MVRYISMAVDSSARACSCWPMPGVQRAEATVAVRLERAHAQLLGQGESLCIVGGGRCPLDGRLLGCEVTEEPQGPGFAPPFPVRSGKAEGTCGTLACVVQATRQPIRLAQQGDNAGLLREVPLPVARACSWSAWACSSSGRASDRRPASA